MEVVIFDSNLEPKDVTMNPTRIACRGWVVHEDKVLTVFEEKWNLTTLPGGGLEPVESLEECVVREVKEETGVIVTEPTEMVRVVEHFATETFVSVYFRCLFVKETDDTSFTDVEQDVNLQKRWLPIADLMTVLTEETSLHPYGENIHNREFIGLINSL